MLDRFKATTISLVQLTRLDRCLIAAAYTLLGAYLTGGLESLWTISVWSSAFLVALMVACAFVVNDYKDIDADIIGKSYRPIPSGHVTPHNARRLAVLLAITSLAVAAFLGIVFIWFAVSCITLSLAYSYRLKSTVLLGNGVIALLDATIPIYGGLATSRITPALLIASLLIFFYAFAQEILYTAEDEECDRLVGLRTTATQLGVIRTLQLFRICASLFVIVALVPWFMNLAPNRYLYTVIPCSIIPTVGIMIVMSFNITNRGVRLAAHGTRYVWFSSSIPIVFLG
ncbi:MAG: hypothetical protein OJF52_000460 [Nitrospira sp.]|jgi:4-hydroxybenzoate polyprenyltransferase|nr:MAG: hypothetical protein OJF52_000460 [Nitrospira sp.]